MSKLGKLFENIKVNKKNIKSFIFFLIITIIVSVILVFTPLLSSIGPILLAVVLGVFLFVISILAGYVVFRSLLASSVGLSLIIFIGDEYCHLPVAERVADDSLQMLIAIGWIYVLMQFIYSLYKELFGDNEATDEWRRNGIIAFFKDNKSSKYSWFMVAMYALFIALFVSQIYKVVNPIIKGLCIYQ